MSIIANNRLITLATGANTDVTVENTGGTSTGGFINLPDRGRLVAVNAAITGSAAGPLRAWIRLEQEDMMAVTLAEGWIRVDTIFAQDGAIGWTGEQELDSNSRLQVGLRNDTGSTAITAVAWKVDP